VTVTVGHHGGSTTVTVDDDGPGFDPAAVAGSRGVQNMHDRISAIGGDLAIGTAPGGGTRVEVDLPDPVTVAGASPPG
jgi:signal transduction histidine kinase